MQHEINLGFFWKCLKKCWIIMVVATVVVALLVGLYASFIPKKMYSSSVEFYIINTNTSYDYTTQALLAASQYLIVDYTELIKSDAVLGQIADYMNKDRATADVLKVEELRGMISSYSSGTDTSLFTIKVTNSDPALAYEVACAIREVAPSAVTDIAKPDRLTNEYLVEVVWASLSSLEKSEIINKNEAITKSDLETLLKGTGLDGSLDCFISVNNPVKDTTPDSPNVPKYVFFAAAITAALVYVIFFIKGLLQMNISSEDDVKEFVKKPIVGTIPHWENSTKK